jgi:thiamine-monophosphate kinase
MGEFELLARVRERLPPAGPRIRLGSGDDAAVTVPGGATATSVDALVDGVHFRRDTATLAQIGRKALGAALSDLAAMGGIGALAAETGTTLAGGDVTRAPALTLVVTVVGHAATPEQLVNRGGAEAGDALVVTGEIGGAAAGLILLQRPQLAASLPAETAARLRLRQLDPVPRLGAGRALAKSGARAMIDLSDGLGGDAGHLAAQSGARVRIDAGALPLASGVAEIAAAVARDPLELATSGGEDYELLAALPPRQLRLAREAVAGAEKTALTQIGEVLDGEGVEVRLPDGAILAPAGFDQLD